MISITRLMENGEEIKKEMQEKRAEENKKVFELAPLPYREVDLEPVLFPQQIDAHYNGHHREYVETVNAARAENNLISYNPKRGLAMIMDDPAIQHAANQAWNHDFYWKSMSPNGGGVPEDKFVLEAIEKEYDSFSEFKDKFIEEMLKATSTTGSAWGWLVVYREIEGPEIETEIEIVTTRDCMNPYLTTGKTPLCCIDLWEHAYYIDYGPQKGEYIRKWLEKLINWKFVADNFHTALTSGSMASVSIPMPMSMGMTR